MINAEKFEGVRRRMLSTVLASCTLVTMSDLYAQPVECNSTAEEVQLITTAERAPIDYTIALDQIGVLLGGEEPAQKVRNLAEGISGEIFYSRDGGLVIAQLFEPLCRDQLNSLARELRQREDILQAGMVLYQKGSNVPILVTDQLIVGFNNVPDKQTLGSFAQELGVIPIVDNALLNKTWLFSVAKESENDVIAVVQQASVLEEVDFAIPDFVQEISPRGFTPNDPLIDEQWHHRNYGQASGTEDADIDSDSAWALSLGSKEIIIAILDMGFEIGHEDLAPNLWINPHEFPPGHPNDMGDDDANNCLDDINGCNFSQCVYNNIPCGTGTFSATMEHGTSVAGIAAGRGDNTLGISGVCPKCTLMPIQVARFDNAWAIFSAITYAGEMNAHVLNNSWGYNGSAVPIVVSNAINAVAALGTVIFWASGNAHIDGCAQPVPDIIKNSNVIAVAASSNLDRKVTESAFGDCLDLMAPSYGGYGPNPNQPQGPNEPPIVGYPYTGTLHMVTTDRTGSDGWNDVAIPNTLEGYDPSFCTGDTANKSYTRCFSGTSAAAPVAAGIAGLVLSADSTLTRLQVQRLLQDTADKIEPAAAHYGGDNGYSSSGGTSTHAYGRTNAYEAVRVVATTALGGTDIFLRDNHLDWGNTSQFVATAWPGWAGSNVLLDPVRGFIPHYRSIDIKVDAPPHQTPPTTSVQFDAFTHENPTSGKVNKVYVRVHNRGPEQAADVVVKLHWAMAGTALPALPSDFWSAWPGDSTAPANPWNTIGSETIPSLDYSGASIAGTSTDSSAIVSFSFTGPPLDPSMPSFRHHCLLAVIDSADDRVAETRLVPDMVTPTNNNVTHLNVSVQDPTASGNLSGLLVRNPFSHPIVTRVTYSKPENWDVSLGEYSFGRAFEMAAGQELPLIVDIKRGRTSSHEQVEVRQEIKVKEEFMPLGGFVFKFSPEAN